MKSTCKIAGVLLVLCLSISSWAKQPTANIAQLEKLNADFLNLRKQYDQLGGVMEDSKVNSYARSSDAIVEGLENYSTEAKKKGDAYFFQTRAKTYLVYARAESFRPTHFNGKTITWSDNPDANMAKKYILAAYDLTDIFKITKLCSQRAMAEKVAGIAAASTYFKEDMDDCIAYIKTHAPRSRDCKQGSDLTADEAFIIAKYKVDDGSSLGAFYKRG